MRSPGDSPVQQRLAQMEGKASAYPPEPDPDFALPGRGVDPMDPSIDPWKGGELVKLNESVELARTAQKTAAEAEAATQQVAKAYPDNAPGGTEIVPVRVTVLGQSNVETTVTPQTIRSAVREALDLGMPLPEVQNRVKALLPRRRVNQLEYVTTTGSIGTNSEGVVNAADSIWLNEITGRGLAEGWVRVDPDSMELVFNRKAALELDEGEASLGVADGLDQADDAARYDEWLKQRTPTESMDSPVQRRLGQMEAGATPSDASPSSKASQEGVETAYDEFQGTDPALVEGERKAVEKANELQALNNEQLQRIANDFNGNARPEDVIADAFGIDVNGIPRPVVEKAQVGRGWEVYGTDGEVLRRFTKKAEAQKFADKETASIIDELARRAQQQLDDGGDQVLRFAEPAMVRNSSLEGNLKLTAKQVEEIAQYLGLDPALAGGKGEHRVSQAEMDRIAAEIGSILEVEDVPPNRRRVLKNLAEKLDLEVQRLAPEAGCNLRLTRSFPAQTATCPTETIANGQACM